jgi:hypothetical protein
MIRVTSTLSGLLLALTAAACGSQNDSPKLNIGETEVLGEQLSDYAATWEGYAEAYEFGSDDQYGDNLYLTLDENGVGHLRVGNAPLAPPATDPSGVYPPSVVSFNFGSSPSIGFPSGVDYPIHNSGVSAHRLRFEILTGNALDTWCPLQTPYEDTTTGSYQCLPNAARTNNNCSINDDGIIVGTDCFTVAMCLYARACDCDAESCWATPGDTVTIDATLEDNGETLSGTLLIGEERVTIRMTRAQ